MTCEGCKWFKNRKGRVTFCERYQTTGPTVRCIDFRRKQGQRTK